MKVSEQGGQRARDSLAMCIAAVVVIVTMSWFAASEPIKLHPDNPHYFLWRGKPTVLITSGEHYGAVLNKDFDYRSYLKTLASHGLT